MTFGPLNVPPPKGGPPTGSGPLAARFGDLDPHAAAVGTASPNVLTEGLFQARFGDLLVPCLAPIIQGCPTVFINGMMAARVGDQTGCGGAILKGAVRTRIGSPGDAANSPRDCLQSASDEGSAMVIFN